MVSSTHPSSLHHLCFGEASGHLGEVCLLYTFIYVPKQSGLITKPDRIFISRIDY